jgi:hypothetical protein
MQPLRFFFVDVTRIAFLQRTAFSRNNRGASSRATDEDIELAGNMFEGEDAEVSAMLMELKVCSTEAQSLLAERH